MSFIVSYLSWHYSKALLNIYGIFSNFFWATYRFFSIPLLFKTFFSPWHHLDSAYAKNSGIEDFFSTLVVNFLMRLVGMFMRLAVILAGLFSLVIVFIIEIISFVIWIFLPIIIVWLIYTGTLKVFK